MTDPAPSLASRLPPPGEDLPSDEVFTRFVEHVSARGLSLYPAQEDALLEILAGRNVILNTPTGSGKSLVATAMIFKAMCEGRRAIYTCPIKALVSEKFFALCEDFGAERVGMLTGDASINRDAPILCCTAEILMSMCLREGHWARADYVVMDEFHYFSDRERGVAWEVPLLVLSSATFLLMSATLGDTKRFEEVLTALTGNPAVTVRSNQRPVPLDFEYRETPLHETVAELVAAGRHPIYLVNFTQRAAAEEAQSLMSVDFCTKEEKKAIAEALSEVEFDSPYGKEVQKFLRHGLGIHHAGLLPRYRLAVERLAQKGMLKIISGTDTLGVGVNIPIRTVLFTKLCKYDGEKTAVLTVRDFKQIAGRAGRKGYDDQGWVVAQAPEHVIENLRLEMKAAGDPAKLRKLERSKKKPPERGYVPFDRATFDRLVSAPPEPLQSRFKVTHGMLLAVLQRDAARPHDNCRALGRLIARSLGGDGDKRRQKREAWTIYKSMIDAGILAKEYVEGVERVVVRSDLQVDFNIHNTLAMWLLDTLPGVDRESPDYALDVLTLCEAVVENPEVILQRQLDRIKTEAMAEMKSRGVEYEERIAELEKLEYPKPHRDFIYATFNAFAAKHPWVGAENIRPKSVAREMFESYLSFADYVKEYDLHRVEGVLLRYLSDVYKVLAQTVPVKARTDELREVIDYLRAMIKEVDSSLVDEWERLQRPEEEDDDVEVAPEEPLPKDVTRNLRSFTAMVRRAVFNLVRALANRDWVAAARRVDAPVVGEAWTPKSLESAMEPYFAEHPSIRLDHDARSPSRTRVERESDTFWRVEQVLVDDEGDNDWVLRLEVDLGRSRALDRPVITLVEVTT